MARVALNTGAYQTRSIMAGAQRSVNLYAEENQDGSPVKYTYYPTPGLRPLAQPPLGVGRALYRASNNQLYAVVGSTFYSVSAAWVYAALGTVAGGIDTPVSMADNGTTLLAVDGTSNGYTVLLATNEWGTISNAAFYGADRVDFLDTFFVLNKPNTGEFYSSLANSTAFDPLYFATKIGYADLLGTIAVLHREIWLIGQTTTEVWVDSGAAAFPFEIMNGAFIQHGIAAKYSIAQMGDALFWLSQDLQGKGVVLKGSGYQTGRVSTHAIETALATYSTISDAIGFTYQQEGHQFYVLTFPTADKTWVYDIVTDQWHERMWVDGNGVEHRHRANCCAFVYNENVVADWETGELYALDLDVYTDAGAPIVRRRGFPHMIQDGKRVIYTQFIADMEVGTAPNTASMGIPAAGMSPDTYPDTGLAPDVTPMILGIDNGSVGSIQPPGPQLYLRWSDTKGASWGNPIANDLGTAGDYINSIQFQRLGMARDRVFEVFWSAPVRTALNGAFLEAKACGS